MHLLESNNHIYEMVASGEKTICLVIKPYLDRPVILDTKYNSIVKGRKREKRERLEHQKQMDRRWGIGTSKEAQIIPEDYPEPIYSNRFHELQQLIEDCEIYNHEYDSKITPKTCVKQILKIKKPQTEDIELDKLVNHICDTSVTIIDTKPVIDAITTHTLILEENVRMFKPSKMRRDKLIDGWSGRMIDILLRHKRIFKKVSEAQHPQNEITMLRQIMGVTPQAEMCINQLLTKLRFCVQFLEQAMDKITTDILEGIKISKNIMSELD
jgi:hypothetical protein